MVDLVTVALALQPDLFAYSGKWWYRRCAGADRKDHSSCVMYTTVSLDGEDVMRGANIGSIAKVYVLDRFLTDEIVVETVPIDDALAMVGED